MAFSGTLVTTPCIHRLVRKIEFLNRVGPGFKYKSRAPNVFILGKVKSSPSSSARFSRLSAGSNGFFRDSGNNTMYTSSGEEIEFLNRVGPGKKCLFWVR